MRYRLFMARTVPVPEDATPLLRWMHRFNVTAESLADVLGCNAIYLGRIRRGEARPADPLKISIEIATLQFEADLGIPAEKRQGVRAVAWSEEAEIARMRKAGES